MGKKNKVRYNLKNVHYAPITAEAEGNGFPTYGTPVPWPGAVSLSLDQQGSISKFHADGIVYWQDATNNGYEGDLEMALILDQFRQDCLGEELHETDQVFLENATAKTTPFALMFEFDGDATKIRHVLYNCTATRPSVEGSTTEDSKSPVKEKLTISAAALDNGYVKARTGPDTPAEVVNAWYKKVYIPSDAAPVSVRPGTVVAAVKA